MRAPRVAAFALSLALAAGTAGARAAETPSRPAEAATLLSCDVRAEIEDGTDEIRTAVADASRLLALRDEPLDTVGALFERARKDEQRLRKALQALGYFGATVKTLIGGKSADDRQAEDALAAAPPPGKLYVVIAVVPGPRFVLRNVRLVPAAEAPAAALEGLTPAQLGLQGGEPARSALVADADRRLVARLREKGYARARVARRDAVADHAAAALDVTLVVDPGARVTFGTVVVQGTGRMNPAFVAGLAPFRPGDPFQASLLADFRSEIERLNVFDAISMTEADTIDAESRLDLYLDVHERLRRVIGAQASWSTLEGASLGAYWEHRNLFGEAERLRIEATSSRLFLNSADDYEYALAGSLTVPAWPTRRDDVTLRTEARRERPDAYARDALEAAGAWKRRFDRTLSVEAGVALVHAREEDALGRRDRTTFAVPLSIVLDTRNNPLEPVSGVRASAELRPMTDLGGAASTSVRLLAQVSTYLRLDDDAHTILAGRLAAGLTFGSDTASLPVDQRFFAGGAFEERYPDPGAAGTSVGLGARYRTPIGPVRLDVAVPLDRGPSDPEFAIYVGLGQAF